MLLRVNVSSQEVEPSAGAAFVMELVGQVTAACAVECGSTCIAVAGSSAGRLDFISSKSGL